MNISILGTNGLLSSCIGLYCNKKNYRLKMYGLVEPDSHDYTYFKKVNLLNEQLDYPELKETDVIIYAAGAGIQSKLEESSELIYGLNVSIPVIICNKLKSAGYRGTFISFGSYFEIGASLDYKKYTEVDILQSQLIVPNDYSISKRMLSRFISSFNSPYTFLHFILPTIYGEAESDHRLIPYTLKSIIKNSNLSFTSGDQVRQYIYIDDVIEIIFKSLETNLESGIYNIAGAEEFTVKKLVAELFKLMGKNFPENVFGKEKRIDVGMKILLLNGEKLQKRIKYMPTTKISEIYERYKFNE